MVNATTTIDGSGKCDQCLVKEQQDSGWQWLAIADGGWRRNSQQLHIGGMDKRGRWTTHQQAKGLQTTQQPTIIGSVGGGRRLATRAAGIMTRDEDDDDNEEKRRRGQLLPRL